MTLLSARVALLGLLTGTVVGLSTTGTVTAAPAPRCDGRAATVVGSPGKYVVGTPGPDVIVTNGATSTMAGAGDDLVCVTGTSPRLDAGRGNDVIDATRGEATVVVDLGPGDDRYAGSPMQDDVTPGDGRDEVSTGAGGDQVDNGPQLNGIEVEGPTQQDKVDLGAGQDSYRSAPQDRSTVRGGPGRDRLQLHSDGGTTADITYDAGRGVERRDGRAWLHWRGMDTYLLETKARYVRFLGTDRADDVVLDVPEVARSIDVRVGAGDDVVQLPYFLNGRADIDGGAGHDRVSASNYQGYASSLTAEVPQHVLRFTGDTRGIYGVRNIEAWHIDGVGSVRFVGTAARDVVRITGGCAVVVRAGDSNDAVLATNGQCEDARGVDLNGGPGDDTLVGGRGGDHLVGNRGDDVAVGMAGSDRCAAEVRRSCET